MNFDEAVLAHRNWRIRLIVAIDGHSPVMLDPEAISRDDQCVLGRWIHGEGEQLYGTKPEFAEVKRTHADFHLVAGAVLQKALARDKDGAGALLDGEFVQASRMVEEAMKQCKATCK